METENNLPPGSAPIDFDKIIQESKASLADASAPKRSRGRPPGSGKKQQENPSESTQNGTFKDVKVEIIGANEVEPLANELVKIPFDIAGLRVRMQLTPGDAEAKTPTYYLAKLIQSYLPDLDAKDPKKFNLIAFAVSYALLIVKKFRLFAEVKEFRAREARTQSQQQQQQQSPNPAGTESGPSNPQNSPVPLPSESIPAGALFNNGAKR